MKQSNEQLIKGLPRRLLLMLLDCGLIVLCYYLAILLRFDDTGAVIGTVGEQVLREGNRQQVHAGGLGKAQRVLRRGVSCRVRHGGVQRSLAAADMADFRFYGHAMLVRVIHHAARERDVFLPGERAGVDHHRGEAVIDRPLDGVKAA